MLFQPYIVIHENVQDDSEVVWAPLSNETKCFLSSQNFFHVVALKFTHDLRPRHMSFDNDNISGSLQIDG